MAQITKSNETICYNITKNSGSYIMNNPARELAETLRYVKKTLLNYHNDGLSPAATDVLLAEINRALDNYDGMIRI